MKSETKTRSVCLVQSFFHTVCMFRRITYSAICNSNDETQWRIAPWRQSLCSFCKGVLGGAFQGLPPKRAEQTGRDRACSFMHIVLIFQHLYSIQGKFVLLENTLNSFSIGFSIYIVLVKVKIKHLDFLHEVVSLSNLVVPNWKNLKLMICIVYI